MDERLVDERQGLIQPGSSKPKRSGKLALAILGGLSVVLAVFLCCGGKETESIVANNAAVAVGDIACPGSAAFVHASCKLASRTSASCEIVAEEVLARVYGQFETWHDPHNNGTYTLLRDESGSPDGCSEASHSRILTLKRLTGDQKYTDKMTLTLRSTCDGNCMVLGCSESQVTSVADFSTNYCNLRNLICGSSSKPSCKTVKHDFSVEQVRLNPSIGASTDENACVKV